MKAPAFQWYPKDCDTDERVRAMDDREFGFYMRCLNHSWLNDGLPGDLGELARVLHRPASYVRKIWERVGKCFELQNERYVNPKQEEQRKESKEFSESRRNAANTRWDKQKECKPDARALHLECPASASPPASAPATASEERARLVPMPQPVDYGARYRALYDRHIIPGWLQEGEYEYSRLLQQSPDAAKTADQIDAAHAEWMAYLADNPNEFRPGIAKWLKDGYWTRRPPARDSPKPVKVDRVMELVRKERERKRAEGLLG